MIGSISIPSDEEGFVLLQCHLCGEYFKILTRDFKDSSNINIWCPYCGLNGKEYLTDEVINMALKIVKNEVNEIVYKKCKELERKTKNDFLKVKCGHKQSEELITPIKARITNLEIKKYQCCKSVAKIRPLTKMSGSYCPICGGIDYE